MYDPNDPTLKKVWAGGVTGGLWYNNNITSATSPWVAVGDFWSCLAIRCITYDPLNTQTFYVGTGEAETALQTYRESSGLGFGIFKSSDGGTTWDQIPGTEHFAYITDLVVRVENNVSVIYAGVASGLYEGAQHQSQPSDGLFRSADQGLTWQQVLPNIPGTSVPYCVSDIALGADNRLYTGTRPNLDGNGAAVILSSDNGTQWTANDQYQQEILATVDYPIPGRVVLSTAASDPNVVYALIASGFINPTNGFQYFYCFHVLKSTDKGVTWTKKAIPSNLTSGNNFATIAWHALDIAVDPNNANALFIGGLDVHKSFNSGTTWLRVSDWSRMYSGGGPDYIHADQHCIVYKPGSSDEVLFGSDGGVFYTNEGSATVPYFSEHNTGYNTLQLYTCALHPQAGFNQFYGGLQDNGTLFYVGLGDPITINDMVSGGDGAYCFIDQKDPATSIASVYYNQYSVFDNGNYINSLSNWSSGTFVSPADLDDNLKMLYCNAVDYAGNYQDQILRIKNLIWNSNGTFINVNTGSQVPFTALRYSPYSPAGTTTLFAGTAAGRLFRITGAQTNTPSTQEITGSSFPAASLSCIAIGKSEDTLMVTFTNYGVPSVWITADRGNTWINAEGNLPDMPVRWGAFHPGNDRQALLATETGVWECTNLFSQPVTWAPVNTGMANVRVDMLRVRPSDNTVLAATHGRGFFTMTWDLFTGIKDKNSPTFNISPNPSTGDVVLQLPGNIKGIAALTITDQKGKILMKENLPLSGETSHPLTLTHLPSGLYLLTLTPPSPHPPHTQKLLLY
jgi:photosystem II stability/assembly factor-like uncharacterized protein